MRDLRHKAFEHVEIVALCVEDAAGARLIRVSPRHRRELGVVVRCATCAIAEK